MAEDIVKPPANICVAIVDDKASTKSLTDVVEEITLWTAGREGLPFKLHLLHVALLLPDRSEQAEEVKQQAKRFMGERFLPILEKLPESCDWQLHVISILRPVLGTDPNRRHLDPRDKKYLAAAICREAHKLGATEIVVNKHDKGERGLSARRTVAEKVVKYSSVPVRVIGTEETETHLGKGKDPHVLDDNELPDARKAQEELERVTPSYPVDKTDAYSTAKRIVKGVRHLVGFRKGSKGGQSRSDSGESSTTSSLQSTP